MEFVARNWLVYEMTVPTDAKVAFVDMLAAAGLPAIEVTSFVSPKWVPQLADASDVMARIERREGVRYPVLVPNEQGLDGAIAAGATEVAVFTAAVLVNHLKGDADAALSAILAQVYIVARVVHPAAYVANIAPLRSLAFVAGFVCCIWLFLA